MKRDDIIKRKSTYFSERKDKEKEMQNYPVADDYSEALEYPVPEIPINAWIANSVDFPTGSYVNHWHRDFEFAYVTKGTMKENINGEILTLKAGDLLFINSESMHFNFWSEPCDCEVLCMVLHPSLIEGSGAKTECERLCAHSALSHMLFLSGGLSHKDLKEAYFYLHSIVRRRDIGGFEFMSAVYRLFSLLFAELDDTGRVSPAERRQIEIMHRITGYIQKNYQSKLSLEDIAASGLVCRSTCGSLFRRFLGKTPIEYLTEYRISKSLELLRGSDMTITEIAIQCGFGGASYYTEKFVAIMGFTPTDFRRQQK